jgi:hypothetical protein
MEIVHKAKSYQSGGDNHNMELDYDYMLFRQDWNGSERVYFNIEDIEKVVDAIGEGLIPIHPNYSILYAKREDLLTEEVDFGCYCTTIE